MSDLKQLHQDIQLWMGDYDVIMRQDAYDALAMMLETYSRRAKSEAGNTAMPDLPGCLADRLYEAIKIARDRAQHAGSTPRMQKWDATAADLRAAIASSVNAPIND